MPLRWIIDHSRKFVHIVVADGPLTLKDMEEHFDAIAVADAMGYAKLFDATRFQPVYSDGDVMAMGARLSAYTTTLESGPLAVVGTDLALDVAFRRFTNVSPAERPGRALPTEVEARAWLGRKRPPPAWRRRRRGRRKRRPSSLRRRKQ